MYVSLNCFFFYKAFGVESSFNDPFKPAASSGFDDSFDNKASGFGDDDSFGNKWNDPFTSQPTHNDPFTSNESAPKEVRSNYNIYDLI